MRVFVELDGTVVEVEIVFHRLRLALDAEILVFMVVVTASSAGNDGSSGISMSGLSSSLHPFIAGAAKVRHDRRMADNDFMILMIGIVAVLLFGRILPVVAVSVLFFLYFEVLQG